MLNAFSLCLKCFTVEDNSQHMRKHSQDITTTSQSLLIEL